MRKMEIIRTRRAHARAVPARRGDRGGGDGPIRIPRQLGPPGAHPEPPRSGGQAGRPEPRRAAPNRKGSGGGERRASPSLSPSAPVAASVGSSQPWLLGSARRGRGVGMQLFSRLLPQVVTWLRRVVLARWAGPRGVLQCSGSLGCLQRGSP
jgi:hypothetical protein